MPPAVSSRFPSSELITSTTHIAATNASSSSRPTADVLKRRDKAPVRPRCGGALGADCTLTCQRIASRRPVLALDRVKRPCSPGPDGRCPGLGPCLFWFGRGVWPGPGPGVCPPPPLCPDATLGRRMDPTIAAGAAEIAAHAERELEALVAVSSP